MHPRCLKLIYVVLHDSVLVEKHLVELYQKIHYLRLQFLILFSIIRFHAHHGVFNALFASLCDHIIELLDPLEASNSQQRDQDAVVCVAINIDFQLNNLAEALLRPRVILLPLSDCRQLTQMLVHRAVGIAIKVALLLFDDGLHARPGITHSSLFHLNDGHELLSPPDVVISPQMTVLANLNQVHLSQDLLEGLHESGRFLFCFILGGVGTVAVWDNLVLELSCE